MEGINRAFSTSFEEFFSMAGENAAHGALSPYVPNERPGIEVAYNRNTGLRKGNYGRLRLNASCW